MVRTMGQNDRDALAEYRLRRESTVKHVHPVAHGQRPSDTDGGDQWQHVAETVELTWRYVKCGGCNGRGRVKLAGIRLDCDMCYGKGHIGVAPQVRQRMTPEKVHYRKDGSKRYKAIELNGRLVIYSPHKLPTTNRDGSKRKRGRIKNGAAWKLIPATPGDATLFYTGQSAHMANQVTE